MITQSKDFFINPDILGYSMKICSQATKNPQTFEFITPQCVTLMKDYAVDLVMLTKKDLEDFSDNPMDFIRKMKDVTETFYSCKHSALEMIIIFCHLRSDPKAEPFFLREFFDYCVKSLAELTEKQESDFRYKDAFLAIIQKLGMLLIGFPNYNNDIEQVLGNYCLPMLKSENGLERYRALMMYFEFSYLMKDEHHLMSVGEQIYMMLDDNDIVVKISAAMTLYRYLKKEQLKSLFESQLSKILETYLEMMNELESEDLVLALEQIVSIYADSIEPYAIQLCEKLADNYWKL